MKQTFIIQKSKEGVVHASSFNSIIKHIEGHSGYKFRVEVEQYRAKRSNQQNRYLHQIFTILKEGLNELGNEFTKDEVKELCKYKFAKIDIINHETGELIGQRIKGTSEMNKMEMAEFIENVIRWSADMFHIILPQPGQQLTIE